MNSLQEWLLRISGACRRAIPEFGSGDRKRVVACICFLALFTVGVIATAADIRNTPHNLAQKRSLVESDEVCVFCHTPQLPPGLENITGTGQLPAWQPSLKSHDFVMFDDIGRKQFGKMAVGSQSIACLSCHDSNQAFQVTGGEKDHPFGVPYRGFVQQRGQVGGEQMQAEIQEGVSRPALYLQSVGDFKMPSKGKLEKRTIWWVSPSGTTATRTRSDLPLYVRQEEGGETPYIECSSCHDPHVVRPLFLRVTNQGGTLCLTCHDK